MVTRGEFRPWVASVTRGQQNGLSDGEAGTPPLVAAKPLHFRVQSRGDLLPEPCSALSFHQRPRRRPTATAAEAATEAASRMTYPLRDTRRQSG